MNLKVDDYFQTGKRSLIRFREKGGEPEFPVHHKLEEVLDRYLEYRVFGWVYSGRGGSEFSCLT